MQGLKFTQDVKCVKVLQIASYFACSNYAECVIVTFCITCVNNDLCITCKEMHFSITSSPKSFKQVVNMDLHPNLSKSIRSWATKITFACI